MGNEFETFKKMVELARNNDPDAQNDLGVYIMDEKEFLEKIKE